MLYTIDILSSSATILLSSGVPEISIFLDQNLWSFINLEKKNLMLDGKAGVGIWCCFSASINLEIWPWMLNTACSVMDLSVEFFGFFKIMSRWWLGLVDRKLKKQMRNIGSYLISLSKACSFSPSGVPMSWKWYVMWEIKPGEKEVAWLG